MVRDQVEKEVVFLSAAREIFSRVINDSVSADGPDHLHVSRTANTCNFSTKYFGDLHGECTNTSGRTINQNLLTRSELCVVA
jgi:hypothetical protein